MLAQARDIAKDLGDRVTFQQHDFFQPQPVEDGGAYFLRQITHNWNDDECIQIFRSTVPALEKCPPGTPLLINDTILPAFNTKTKYEEHLLQQLDIAMLVLAGAKQRTEEEFKILLQQADPRLKVRESRTPLHTRRSSMSTDCQGPRTGHNGPLGGALDPLRGAHDRLHRVR